MITHFVSDELRDIIHLAVTFSLGYLLLWLGKAGISSSKSRVGWSVLAGLFFVYIIRLAFQTHHRSGFFNGVLFATTCFGSFSFMLAVAYLFNKKFFSVRKRVTWTKKSQLWKWETHTVANGNAGIVSASRNSLRFRAQFSGAENRWANMEIVFAEVQDFRDYAGVKFDIKCDDVYPNSFVKLKIGLSDNSFYISEKSFPIINQKAFFLFQEMRWADWTSPSSFDYLDWHLQHVIKVAVECHAACDDVKFSVSNFALLRRTAVVFQTGAA